MKEKNRIKLKKGLQGLPEYSPPDKVWSEINEQLDIQQNDAPLHKAIAELPAYDPPSTLWDSIEAELPNGKVRQLNPTRANYSKWLVAASIAMLMGAGFWFMNGNGFSSKEIVSFSYDTQAAFEGEREEDNADEMIAMVVGEVQQVQHQWEAPETVALKSSLDKIRSSIKEFKVAGEKLGMNQSMHKQLTDMYNKRNKIVRALAAKI